MLVKKKTRNELLYDFAYFVTVLAIASLLLAYLFEVRPDMVFERRTVAYQTASVLNLFGVNSNVSEYAVYIPNNNPELNNISSVLSLYGFRNNTARGGVEYRISKLPSDSEGIIDAYVSSLQSQGLQVYASKAVVIASQGGKEVEAYIIQECVGWVGIFAISALIIGYPRVPRKKRYLGLVISWPLMYVFNIARLSITITSGFGGQGVIDFTHDLLFKAVLIIWAIVLWLFWVWFVVEEKNTKDLKKLVRR